MSSEGTPQAEPSLLAHPLGLATRLVLRFPWPVVIAAVVLAVLSLVISARFLGFRASRLDLLNPTSPYNKRWVAYLDEFGEDDDVVVVVEADRGDQLAGALDELAEAISREQRYFYGVLHRIDLQRLRTKGLHFLTIEQLEMLDHFLARLDPILRDGWSGLGVDKQLKQLNGRAARQRARADPRRVLAETAAETQRLADRLAAALGDPPTYRSSWPELGALARGLHRLDSQYLRTRDGRLGFVLLRIVRSKQRFTQGSEAIDKLRRLIRQVQSRHPEVKIGLTGMPVLENDEMRTSQQDMLRASVLSLFGVACLFVAGFGGLRHPLMTVAALILAIAWSFGYVTLAVGHLNILSVAFGVILIGLGIDFGIHYVARYLQLRRTIPESGPALVKTAVTVGPGVLTGGITTALAFSAAALTDFTGVAELGIIAGGGIVLCILGALLVLPAMIHLADRNRAGQDVPLLIPLDSLFRPFFRLPRLTVIAGLGLTAALACGVVRVRYDHNLLNLQPARLESVRWERRLIANSDHSVWYALSMARSPAEIRRRKEQLENLESVDRTEEVASLLPPTSAEKLAVIRAIARRLSGLPEAPPVIPVVSREALDEELAVAQRRLEAAAVAPRTGRALSELRKQLRGLAPREYFQRLSRYQQRVCAELLERLQQLSAWADPAPPGLDDIPAGLRRRFVSRDNWFLLKVFARGDIWQMDRLQRFVADLETVDPEITGHPVQTYYASRQMQLSYIHAAIYSLLAVTIVLMLDFCNLRLALLALLPMGLGALQLFGLLGLLDIPLNPANMIVLPLILGIGIDDGVHVIHDFQRQAGQYRLSRSTATAVLITSATTMVGFGMMMFADHQGLRSLGQVLTIGAFCCLGTSIVILPALLTWISRPRRRGQPHRALRARDGQAAAGRGRRPMAVGSAAHQRVRADSLEQVADGRGRIAVRRRSVDDRAATDL